MGNQYRVEHLSNATYQVIDQVMGEVAFQGGLADCEAYIRLKEQGYM